jgi:DNA polymerase-3 subunit beta
MRFSLQREVLLKPLAQVVNVVERRQTLPVLANLLARVDGDQLSLTGTDLEVEMVARTRVEDAQAGETTIPARKLFEIVRALPDGSKVTITQAADKVTVSAGRSRFSLASLPANDFPSLDEVDATERVKVAEASLKELIERTAFAMAQQDVRYYLNGLLFDLREKALRCVATDGHRLALCEAPLEELVQTKRQIIVPRKGVLELQRLLEGGDRELELEMGRSHIRVKRDDVTFTSKLIDGRFPDYEAVIPIGADREVRVDREVLRASLQRAAILSNEKYRGVRIEVSPGQVKINAHNPEQEEAQEEVEADTKVDGLTIGFNVNYLLDALSALREEHVLLLLRDANSSALVREATNDRCRHVVMPLRL